MFEGKIDKMNEIIDEMGNDHISSSANNPIREDAFELTEKEKIDSAEVERLERIRHEQEKQAEEDRETKESEEMEKKKNALSKMERKILRHRALEEIGKMDGVKEEFISESLISAKENEILRSEGL